MQVTVTVPDEVAIEAEERGLSVEAYLETLIARAVAETHQVADDPEARRKAVDRMRSFADEYGFTLGPDLTIKDLINEGRKY